MSDDQNKKKFSKIKEIYSKRYDYSIPSFIQFLNDRIDCSTFEKDTIKEKIIVFKDGEQSINQEELQDFMHLVAAVQAHKKITSSNLKDYEKYFNVKFVSKRDKKKKEKKEEQELPQETSFKKKQEIVSEVEIEHEVKKEEVKERQIIEEKGYTEIQEKELKKNSIEEQRQPPNKLSTIDQDESDVKNISSVSNTSQDTSQFFMQHEVCKMPQKKLQILGYHKSGQDYHNSIIKFKIHYNNKTIYRRYSQFGKLMSYLGQKYEGYILPELPPKEGIKRNFAYFWGIDETFLNDRQIKLEEMLNSLLELKDVNEDHVLDRFVTDDSFDIISEMDENSYSYLKAITDIAFNTKELKDYGLAYYNYLRDYSASDINNEITAKYNELTPLIQNLTILNNYRTKIGSNFDQRREIFKNLKCDKDDRIIIISDFDRELAACSKDIKNLNNELNKYRQLKMQENWINYLMKQKEVEKGMDYEKVKNQRREIEKRISKMEKNLINSFQDFKCNKQQIYEKLGPKLIEWRKCVHP